MPPRRRRNAAGKVPQNLGNRTRTSRGSASARDNSFSVLANNEADTPCIGICGLTFSGDDEQMLCCERCEGWICRACVNISEDEYKFMTEWDDLHWFCSGCEVNAMSAVITDADIEEKCKTYCSNIEKRLT